MIPIQQNIFNDWGHIKVDKRKSFQETHALWVPKTKNGADINKSFFLNQCKITNIMLY